MPWWSSRDNKTGPRWTSRVPGSPLPEHIELDVAGGSVYVNDGWGVTYAATRFRRLDLTDGRERATFRPWTAVRCLAWLPGRTEFIAATDTKLFRLDATSLADRQRWDQRVPRYSNSMVVAGDRVALADWVSPRVSVLDFVGGSVRRRDAPGMMTLLPHPKGALVVGGARAGGTGVLDMADVTVWMINSTPPAMSAVLDANVASFWMLAGVAGYVTSTSTGPGSASRDLRRYPMAGGPPDVLVRLPSPARHLAAGGTAVWAADGGRLQAVSFENDRTRVSEWRAPRGHEIRAMDPDAGIVISVTYPFAGEASDVHMFEVSV